MQSTRERASEARRVSALTTEAQCPACGGAFEHRVGYPRQRRSSGLDFSEIAVCSTCGLGVALPRRTQHELDAFYASGEYWADTVGSSRVQTLHERNQCRHRVRLTVGRLPSRMRIRALDVGAGHGWTAYWLNRLAAGDVDSFDFVEPDDALAREIVSREASTRARRLHSLEAASGPYQLVFLNHVLEHVADPVDAVERIRALLAPDGIAYLEMPHADYRFKPDVFPHTWFFTHAALRHLGHGTGVTEVLRESFGRFPTRAPVDLFWRGAFRACAVLDMPALAGFFDDRVWRYGARDDGMWLRWIVRR